MLSYFNRRYIKDSVFPEELGIAINRAFDIRQRGDYKEDIIIEKEQSITISKVGDAVWDFSGKTGQGEITPVILGGENVFDIRLEGVNI